MKANLKIALFDCGCIIKSRNLSKIIITPCKEHKKEQDKDSKEWYAHLEDMQQDAEQGWLDEED